MKNSDNLIFVCSLIEYIARETKNHRNDVIYQLGPDAKQIYDSADALYCEPIAKAADDYIKKHCISTGEYDNISSCQNLVPDCWDIGEVFAHLIEDCCGEKDITEGLKEVYGSWMTEKILDFDSDLYYQPRDYIAECYREGEIL